MHLTLDKGMARMYRSPSSAGATYSIPPMGSPSNPSPYPSGNTDMNVASPSLRRITRSRAWYAASSTVSRCHWISSLGASGGGMTAATSDAADPHSSASVSRILAVEVDVDQHGVGAKRRETAWMDAKLTGETSMMGCAQKIFHDVVEWYCSGRSLYGGPTQARHGQSFIEGLALQMWRYRPSSCFPSSSIKAVMTRRVCFRLE